MKTWFLSKALHSSKRIGQKASTLNASEASGALVALRALARIAKLGSLVGVLIGVLYFAPAAWMNAGVEKLSNHKLTLIQAKGTLWQGSGVLLIKGGGGSFEPSGFKTNDEADKKSLELTRAIPQSPDLYISSPFYWQLGWFWGSSQKGSTTTLEYLNSASLISLSVENLCCLQSALVLHYRPSWSDISTLGFSFQIEDSKITLPAQWLTALGAPWNTVDPKGVMYLQTQNAKFTSYPFSEKGKVFHGVAELTIKDLSSQLSTLAPLGTYRVTISDQNLSTPINLSLPSPASPPPSPVSLASPVTQSNTSMSPALHLSLQTLEGRLELSGEGEWRNKHLYFNGLAKAQAGFEAALANLLGVLGPRHDNTATLQIG